MTAADNLKAAFAEHEEIARLIEKLRNSDDLNDQQITFACAEAADALSRTAGQEWREPEGWNTTSNACLEVKLRDYKEKLAAEIGSSIEAKIKTGSKNVFDIGHEVVEGRLVQSLLKVALSAAPPVAEPIVAERPQAAIRRAQRRGGAIAGSMDYRTE